MPLVLSCWHVMLEVDVGGMAVQVEPFSLLYWPENVSTIFMPFFRLKCCLENNTHKAVIFLLTLKFHTVMTLNEVLQNFKVNYRSRYFKEKIILECVFH